MLRFERASAPVRVILPADKVLATIDVVEQPLACGAEGKDQDLVCEAPLSPTTPSRESRSSSRGDAKCSIDLAHLHPFSSRARASFTARRRRLVLGRPRRAGRCPLRG